MIIDGRGMSKSAAAMVKGYADFDPDTRIAGVIINKIASESHYQLLKEMIETCTGVPCVGLFSELSGYCYEQPASRPHSGG